MWKSFFGQKLDGLVTIEHRIGPDIKIAKPMPLAVLHCVGQWDDSFH